MLCAGPTCPWQGNRTSQDLRAKTTKSRKAALLLLLAWRAENPKQTSGIRRARSTHDSVVLRPTP